jgi:hypothetical protein
MDITEFLLLNRNKSIAVFKDSKKASLNNSFIFMPKYDL